MSEPQRPLRVVGPPWMADDLGAVHDRGFDAPSEPSDFWCSGTHYARLHASGLDVAFTSPGGCLPLIGRTRRRIDVMPAEELLRRLPTGRVFAKPNDLKLPETFPAAVYDQKGLVQRVDSVLGSRLRYPEKLLVAISEPTRFVREVRCFVHDGRATHIHPYADGHGIGWGLGTLHPQEHHDLARTADAFAGDFDAPRAFVLDLGLTDSGWEPIETNPASSSGWYSTNPPQAVAEAIRAGQHDCARHTWEDPLTHLRTTGLPRG